VLRTATGLFLIAHGLVHILYVVQSAKTGGVLPGLRWPDGSWALSRGLGVPATKRVATVTCLIATVAFVVAGVAVLLDAGWWSPAVVGAAVFSAAVFVSLWDGSRKRMPDQGWIGVLIDAALVLAAVALS
jgi:hypothetical protein